MEFVWLIRINWLSVKLCGIFVWIITSPGSPLIKETIWLNEWLSNETCNNPNPKYDISPNLGSVFISIDEVEKFTIKCVESGIDKICKIVLEIVGMLFTL